MMLGKCQDCGTPIDGRGKRCRDCYIKNVKDNAKSGRHNKTLYPCIKYCGNFTTKKGSQCLECYKKSLNIGFTDGVFINNRKYPCRNKCGRMTRVLDGLCKVCLDAERLKLGEAKQAEKNKKRAENLEKLNQRLSPRRKEICPNRNGLGHYWIINSDNYGRCKYCPAKKDFRRIQQLYKIPQIISAESYS